MIRINHTNDELVVWRALAVAAFLFFITVLYFTPSNNITNSPNLQSSNNQENSQLHKPLKLENTPYIPVTTNAKLDVSLYTVSVLSDFKKANTSVTDIAVSTVNFETNQLEDIFVLGDGNYRTQPLFSSDLKSNGRTLNVMKGEVACGREVDQVEMSCAVAVPPISPSTRDAFSGFLTVYFSSYYSPSSTERAKIHNDLNDLSHTIYYGKVS